MSEQQTLAIILQLAGGEIVGRVRLQKVFFLLDKLGLDSEFEYEYHHFGPYSDELSDCVYFSSKSHLISERTAHRVSDGVRYSVFSLQTPLDAVPDRIGSLPIDQAKTYVHRLKSEDATVLELAATIVWLKEEENVADWENELRVRKAAKVTQPRVDKALHLLSDIGLR